MEPDFLVCSESLALFVDGSELQSCVRPVFNPVVIRRRGFVALVPRSLSATSKSGQERTFFVSGALMSPDYFICHSIDNATVDYSEIRDRVKTCPADFSGVFCLLSMTDAGLEIYTDEPRQFLLFGYIDGLNWVVASDPWSIVDLLRRNGVHVERDYDAVFMAMIYGTTLGGQPVFGIYSFSGAIAFGLARMGA
jgi:hypothetical protein